MFILKTVFQAVAIRIPSLVFESEEKKQYKLKIMIGTKRASYDMNKTGAGADNGLLVFWLSV